MENELQNLFQYSRDAVLCVKDGRVLFANSSAAELFGSDFSGESASKHLPAHLLSAHENSFISCADILGQPCTVSAAHWRGSLVLAFQPESPMCTKTGFLSDGLVASMMSALCNIGFAMDLISERLEKKDEESRRYASIIYHNYYMLKHLIGNMSTTLAFDAGTAAFLPRSTDLAQLCSELVSTSELMLKGKVHINFSTDRGELIANVDPDLIERMVLNLLANSGKHTPPDGQITLGLKSGSGKAVISVDDTGSGIPPQILKNVFTGYKMSLGSSLTRHPSGGLGLGICRSIAEMHGGSIIIESREGIGTSVRVLLPLDGSTFAQHTSASIPSMENILTEFSDILTSSDYARELMD